MAQQIVKKLHDLNEQAKILLARRIKKSNLQSWIKKKRIVIPLTFDFQSESKEDITATPTPRTVPQSREDKSPGTKKTKRYISFKTMTEPKKSDFEKLNLRPHFLPTNIKNQENKSKKPVEENLKSRYNNLIIYLKDKDEAEYAKPLHELHSQHRQECRRKLGATISSPPPSIQSDAYKKKRATSLCTAQTEKSPEESFDLVDHLEDNVNKRRKSPPQMNDFRTKGNTSVRNDVSEPRSVGKERLLPLCFEDELKKPNAKIININPAKTVTSRTKQNDTNPTIFHETGHVQMLLLSENRLPLHPLEDRSIYPHKRKNSVFERNREILKCLMNSQCITSSKPKSTVPTTWRKGMQAISFTVGQRVVEDKVRKKTTMQTPRTISWKKIYNFSEPFPSLTKISVCPLSKTDIQETGAKTGKFERMLSPVKPMSKFSASLAQSSSKSLKNVLIVHKLHTVTPLDDLLTFSSEN